MFIYSDRTFSTYKTSFVVVVVVVLFFVILFFVLFFGLFVCLFFVRCLIFAYSVVVVFCFCCCLRWRSQHGLLGVIFQAANHPCTDQQMYAR